MTDYVALNAKRPPRRLRWPLRGGRRCRYNGGPFVTTPRAPEARRAVARMVRNQGLEMDSRLEILDILSAIFGRKPGP